MQARGSLVRSFVLAAGGGGDRWDARGVCARGEPQAETVGHADGGWCALAGDGGGRVQVRRRATTLGPPLSATERPGVA